MELRIGFLILRDTSLKTMGCLIDVCINHGYPTVLFYDDTAISGSKAYQRITPEKLNAFGNKGAILVNFNISELGNICNKAQVDVLVTHEGYYNLKDKLNEIVQLRRKGMKIVSLCHFFEIAGQPLDALTFFDKTYYPSEYARDLHFQLKAPSHQVQQELSRYEGLHEVAGSPMFDQLANLDRKRFKKDIEIPDEQPIVLLFAPVLSRTTNWRYYVWREPDRKKRIASVVGDKKWRFLWEAAVGHSFFDIVKAIRAFCDKHGARLLIKSRLKQNDPAYLSEWADQYYDGRDDTYFPVFSTYKLISAADLCIGVMSMSVVEAVAMSKPTLNIYIPPSVEYPKEYTNISKEERAYLNAVMKKQDGPLSRSDSMVILQRHQILPWFNDHETLDFEINEEAVREYKKRFLGITDIPSSTRIFNSLITLGG